MNSNIIKKILKDDSEKLIIVENGKPEFVVMSYSNYEKLGLVSDSHQEKSPEVDFDDLFPGKRNIADAFSGASMSGDALVDDTEGYSRENSLEDLPIV